jgi:predicted NBD/HSP70 family sugar kinase
MLLNLIRAQGPISRTSIQKRLGLRLASITELTKELLKSRIVTESRHIPPCRKRGRRQTMLRLNPTGRLAIGVEYDAKHILAIVADLDGRLVREQCCPMPIPSTPANVLPKILETIQALLKQNPVLQRKCIGIGLADPGLVDRQNGISLFASMLTDWKNVPVADIIGKHFNLPVMMDSSTHTKTLYEQRFGIATNVQNLVFIEIADGIGCVLIQNGHLYYGANGMAGELGHTQVKIGGPLCRCGNKGCLEAVASFPALVSQAVAAMKTARNSAILAMAGGNRNNVRVEHIFKAAADGDSLALTLVDDMLQYLGMAIANTVNLFNPEMLVFESRLKPWSNLIITPLRRIIQRQALSAMVKNLRIEVSELGDKAGVLGAATLVLDDFFAVPTVAASLPRVKSSAN